ncbi:MAG: hypothetical protein KGP28_11435 [Bdellovibrionales bacterium]|nr:hypothetical protein [Bdellovibrionales bacterium]
MSSPPPLIRHAPGSQNSFRIQSRFHSGAGALRKHFDDVFSNPLSADSRRFCWDYWNVPGQYRLLRTPAESFFPKPLFSRFLHHLLFWGRTHLGCQMISHPWLSAYTDHCYQGLHSDVPHGPFSFVYSLTRWNSRNFHGGETLMAKPALLRYFSEMQKGDSHEESGLLRAIPAQFNRLTVFDPRYPHGVRMVNGVDSLLDSRLVIHGWFTDPRPTLEGALSFQKVARPMDAFAAHVMNGVASLKPVSGLLSLRLRINKTGRIQSIDVLSSHLVDPMGALPSKPGLDSILQSSGVGFPRASSETRITIPLLFQG